MKNKEFYKDEIYEVACKRDCFAVNKKTGDVMRCKYTICHDCLFNYLKGFSNCNNCDERAIEWLEQEHIEPILNDVEKRYLEAVIRPFKDRVKKLKKSEIFKDYAELYINVASMIDPATDDFCLPVFGKNDAYLGMEYDKEYTIVELGLFEDE